MYLVFHAKVWFSLSLSVALLVIYKDKLVVLRWDISCYYDVNVNIHVGCYGCIECFKICVQFFLFVPFVH